MPVRSWNDAGNLALQHVHEIEMRIQQHTAAIDLTPAGTGEDLYQLATQLEAIWTDRGRYETQFKRWNNDLRLSLMFSQDLRLRLPLVRLSGVMKRAARTHTCLSDGQSG